MSVLKTLFDNYNNALKNNFLAVNACSGFIIASAGDILCQKLMPIPDETKTSAAALPSSSYSALALHDQKVKDNEIIRANINKVKPNNRKDIHIKDDYIKIDWKRTFDMGLIRASVITPFIYYWYPYVARISPGKQIINIIGRITVDQLFGSPFVILLVFTARTILSNNSLDYLINKMKDQFFPTWKAGLMYWPFIHSITFGIMPQKHQALWAHFASLYWNAILSYYSSIKPK